MSNKPITFSLRYQIVLVARNDEGETSEITLPAIMEATAELIAKRLIGITYGSGTIIMSSVVDSVTNKVIHKFMKDEE